MDIERAKDDLDQALTALQVASEAFDAAMDGLQQTIAAIKVANHAQIDAIAAVVKANKELRN